MRVKRGRKGGKGWKRGVKKVENDVKWCKMMHKSCTKWPK